MSDFRIDKITNRDGSAGTQICGVSTFSGISGMQLPVGPTEYRGGRGIGVFGVGLSPSNVSLDKINIATTGNATAFGNLWTGSYLISPGSAANSVRGFYFGGTVNGNPTYSGNQTKINSFVFSSGGGGSEWGDLQRGVRYNGGCNSDTRAVSGGGSGETNIIEYFNMTSQGNGSSFGDLTETRRRVAGTSSPTRGLFGGGSGPLNPSGSNIIDYVTIASTGNATDYADLTVSKTTMGAASSGTRGLFAGGYSAPTRSDVIDYVTIATFGNAVDFGNLTAANSKGRQALAGASSKTRAVFAGGYNYHPAAPTLVAYNIIDYVTLASTGNATNFGDLTVNRRNLGGCSDTNGGLG